MRINILQHTPNEGPGTILDWAKQRGHAAYIYHPAQFNKLPTAAETDFLVILGGPMSPNDDLPWLAAERQLIRQLLDQGKPLFGACLGAQQIALTLGAAVHPASYKEVGWAPVTKQGTGLPAFPAQAIALHWHQDAFDLPAGSQLVFSSALNPNQGFLYRQNVLGLQFHFEPALVNLREMVVNDGDYAASGNDLHQSAAEILAHGVPAENAALMGQLLDFLVAGTD